MKEQDLLENYISDLQKNERRLIPEQKKKNNYNKSNRKYDKTYKSIVKFKIDKSESDMPDKHSQITSHNHISDKDTITTMVKNTDHCLHISSDVQTEPHTYSDT